MGKYKHEVVEMNKPVKDLKGQKKWGKFVFFGKKVDLSGIAAFLGLF